jgi:hypothetical protein
LRKQIHQVIECRLQQEDFKKEIGIENTGMVFGNRQNNPNSGRIARDRKVEKRQLVMAALMPSGLSTIEIGEAVCDSLCASMRSFLRRPGHSIRKR